LAQFSLRDVRSNSFETHPIGIRWGQTIVACAMNEMDRNHLADLGRANQDKQLSGQIMFAIPPCVRESHHGIDAVKLQDS